MKRLLALFMAAIGLAAGSFAETIDLSTITTDYTITNGTTLTGTLHGDHILSIADGATVTLSGVTIMHDYNLESSYSGSIVPDGLKCKGDATIILEGVNTVEPLGLGEYMGPSGIYVPSESTLTIQGNGSLTATGTATGTGIGGGLRRSCGNIVIKGGTITAKGGPGMAGIGSGDGRACGDITIHGGTITAEGGQGGAGIGAGAYGSCGNIYIDGGTIRATGGYNLSNYMTASGIGAGFGDSDSPSSCGNITIKPGIASVRAIRRYGVKDGTTIHPDGIGKGYGENNSVGTISITEGLLQRDVTGGSDITKQQVVEQWDGNLAAQVLTDGGNFMAFDGTTITGTLSRNCKITIADGATVTLDGAIITNGLDNSSYSWAGINCQGSATIILAPGSANFVKGFYQYYPGIHIPVGATLTIRGTGALNASSNGYGAGIGGGYDLSCGSIVINGGTIIAAGGFGAAGIGGGQRSDPNGPDVSCGDIRITGGATITATGGTGAPGIGCGRYGTCGNIAILHGTVDAWGGSYAAGIGSGDFTSSCGEIHISGGSVTAHGKNKAAGIGCGEDDSVCGDIMIGGGAFVRVEATCGTSCNNPIGVSASAKCTCGDVTVEPGIVSTTSGSGRTLTLEPWDGDLGSLVDDMVIPDGMVVYGTLGGNYKVSIAADAHVTLSNAVINGVNNSAYPWAGLTCLGSAEITLEGTNTITGFYGDYPGIYVPYDDGVYVCGLDIEGDGKLTVSSNGSGAGIGGGKDLDCGGIQIWGGTIIANGGSQGGPGIGGGWASQISYVDCLYITIYGGTITATGGWGAAGIGGGLGCNLYGGINIDGGSVTATGGLYAPGIGSGKNGTCVDGVVIDNPNPGMRVVATCGNYCENAIGAGSGGSCYSVDVSELLFDDHGNPMRTIAPWDGNLSLLNGTGEVTALNGTVIRGTLASGVNYKINIADGAEVILRDATITGGFHADSAYEHAGLTCLGDATIVLEGSNTVKGFHNNYSAIYVPEGCTLVIDGDGALRADVSSTSNYAAAIGGGRFQNCGDIDIEGGTITALGGYYGVGIGGAYRDSTGSDPVTCGDITIGEGIVSVTATRGTGCTEDPIGPGKNCSNYDYVDVNVAEGLNNSLSDDENTRTIWRWDGNLATLTKDAIAADGTVIYGTMSGNYKVSIADGATVTLSNAVINGANDELCKWPGLTCRGYADIILVDENIVNGFDYDQAGVFVPEDFTLWIYGDGSLSANCNTIVNHSGSAGIGGSRNKNSGSIVINGGTITACGGADAAGIGGGLNGTCGDIYINFGEVIAYGGENAPGIGSGTSGTCGDIYVGPWITSVYASFGLHSANAIGAGLGGRCDDVNIDDNLNDQTYAPSFRLIQPYADDGYSTWAADNHIEGDWDDVDSYGIANVFRYAFDEPTGEFTVIDIAFDANGKAVIITPPLVNDDDGFTFTIEASDNVDGTGTAASYGLNASGRTTINETGKTKRFFRLKAE